MYDVIVVGTGMGRVMAAVSAVRNLALSADSCLAECPLQD
jgi:hypothetical protein